MHFARQRRHVDDRIVIVAERIITERADAFLYPNVKLAIGFDPDTKRMLSALGLFRRQRHVGDWPRVIQDIVRNVSLALPTFALF